VDGILGPEEQQSLEELHQYMLEDEGSWALGDGFLNFVGQYPMHCFTLLLSVCNVWQFSFGFITRYSILELEAFSVICMLLSYSYH